VTLAYVGLGSNLGKSTDTLAAALAELERIPGTRVVKRSSLYRSAPLGYAEQPEFVNAVAALDTSLQPLELLHELQAVEARHGRSRSFANAPRTLDLDLLLFSNKVVHEQGLTLPHPRMHERAFVLKPLVEIAPDVEVPGRGAAKDLLERCATQDVERIG
jgi:2-amino-4-hydroxy-6-hydroxymethyldihydropteridine diphosphokinase